jgi:hypothetical protein
VQLAGRGLERAVVGDRDQRVELGGVQVHAPSQASCEAELMFLKKPSLAFTP